MNLLNDAPNFSIVLPGPCDSACAFCFSRKSKASIGMVQYLANLDAVLGVLGHKFYQISITGGEPSLSPYLLPVLSVIARHRKKYTNVLVTSNGSALLQHVQEFKGIVDHVNISRHHYDDCKNAAVFGGKYAGTAQQAADIVDEFGAIGIDVSVNCVVNDDTTTEFIDKFIEFSKVIGFHAIRLRKENGTNDPIPAESEYASKYPILWDGACPVCRTRKRNIRGMDVFFKTSVVEPDEVSEGKLFEIVYKEDGVCYSDWQGKNRVILRIQDIMEDGSKEAKSHFARTSYTRKEVRRAQVSTCGSSRSSCGGPSSYSSCGGSIGRC